MNAKQRKQIIKARDKMASIEDEIKQLMKEETRAYENTPENLQDTDEYEESGEFIDRLTDALDAIEDALIELNELATN